MKIVKEMALMGLGAGAVLAYQKYNKPVMNKMKKMMDKAMNIADSELENMTK